MTFRRLAPAAGFALFVGAAKSRGTDVHDGGSGRARGAPPHPPRAPPDPGRGRAPDAPLSEVAPRRARADRPDRGPRGPAVLGRRKAPRLEARSRRHVRLSSRRPGRRFRRRGRARLPAPAATQGFSSGPSATAELALISWNQLAPLPEVRRSATISSAPRASGSPRAGNTGRPSRPRARGRDGIALRARLAHDARRLAGPRGRALPDGHARRRPDPAPPPTSPPTARPRSRCGPSEEAAYRDLVAETGALFGARHYRHYDFLLTLSDHVAHFGLEHHESSDDRVAERSLIDEDARRMMADLLPHEMVHSWNGKYRRPADLATRPLRRADAGRAPLGLRGADAVPGPGPRRAQRSS